MASSTMAVARSTAAGGPRRRRELRWRCKTCGRTRRGREDPLVSSGDPGSRRAGAWRCRLCGGCNRSLARGQRLATRDSRRKARRARADPAVALAGGYRTKQNDGGDAVELERAPPRSWEGERERATVREREEKNRRRRETGQGRSWSWALAVGSPKGAACRVGEARREGSCSAAAAGWMEEGGGL